MVVAPFPGTEITGRSNVSLPGNGLPLQKSVMERVTVSLDGVLSGHE